MPETAELRRLAPAIAVGLVLADSSVVVLALPDIYRELDVSVTAVVWVLVGFNLVLAMAAVPASHAAGRLGPARVTVGLRWRAWPAAWRRTSGPCWRPAACRLWAARRPSAARSS
jgi:hypothetical protein